MDRNPNAGALGVRMIDSNGRYLPESKRGLPVPWVAFCKIFGLTQLFPKSHRFARYYLGHLPNDKTCRIEVLAGAFMFLRRTAIDQAGMLDERFFMYGEDIDLSYRISQHGFRNYYFPETTILHYKGESTRKGSLNYVVLFYKAMLIFSKKHFADRHNGLFKLLINLAVYFRALLSVLSRLVRTVSYPVRRYFPPLKNRKPTRTLLIASPGQARQIEQILNSSPAHYQVLAIISPDDTVLSTNLRLLQTAEPIVREKPELLLFNINEVPVATILNWMESLSGSKIRTKVVRP
jgi:GT2 family glycosyltransferase